MASKIVEKWIAILDHPYRGEPCVTAVKVPVIETAKQYRPYGEWREISDIAKRALHYRRVVPKHEMFDTEIAAIASLVTTYTASMAAADSRYNAAKNNLAVVTRAYNQICEQTPVLNRPTI